VALAARPRLASVDGPTLSAYSASVATFDAPAGPVGVAYRDADLQVTVCIDLSVLGTGGLR
jgi:hypothetical protein